MFAKVNVFPHELFMRHQLGDPNALKVLSIINLLGQG